MGVPNESDDHSVLTERLPHFAELTRFIPDVHAEKESPSIHLNTLALDAFESTGDPVMPDIQPQRRQQTSRMHAEQQLLQRRLHAQRLRWQEHFLGQCMGWRSDLLQSGGRVNHGRVKGRGRGVGANNATKSGLTYQKLAIETAMMSFSVLGLVALKLHHLSDADIQALGGRLSKFQWEDGPETLAGDADHGPDLRHVQLRPSPSSVQWLLTYIQSCQRGREGW